MGVPIPLLQDQAQRRAEEAAHAAYQELMAKAERATFKAPAGQLHGRAGRRCTLEDGERMLDRCIQERPLDLAPRVMLLRNIMLQNLGRERDVAPLAGEALREAGAPAAAGAAAPEAVPCMQCVLLGVKALHKMGRPEAVPAFVADATRVLPALGPDFDKIAADLHERIANHPEGPEGAALLLASRTFLSSIDLAVVAGAICTDELCADPWGAMVVDDDGSSGSSPAPSAGGAAPSDR